MSYENNSLMLMVFTIIKLRKFDFLLIRSLFLCSIKQLIFENKNFSE